jgi:hypothetical protein
MHSSKGHEGRPSLVRNLRQRAHSANRVLSTATEPSQDTLKGATPNEAPGSRALAPTGCKPSSRAHIHRLQTRQARLHGWKCRKRSAKAPHQATKKINFCSCSAFTSKHYSHFSRISAQIISESGHRIRNTLSLRYVQLPLAQVKRSMLTNLFRQQHTPQNSAENRESSHQIPASFLLQVGANLMQ